TIGRLTILTFLPRPYILALVDELNEYEDLELYIRRARCHQRIWGRAADRADLELMLHLRPDRCSEILDNFPDLHRAIAFAHENGETSQHEALVARLAVVLGATSFQIRGCLEGVEQPCSPMTAIQHLEWIGRIKREEVSVLHMSIIYLNAAREDELKAIELAHQDGHLTRSDHCIAHLVVRFGMSDFEALEIGMRPDVMWNIAKAVWVAKYRCRHEGGVRE
ncbi:MAG: hypothetical protein Q9210_003360, partial [Variospora velana]